MDKKYENGMSLEQLIGEMLKDAKVRKRTSMWMRW